ncbi:hypothetical protein ACTXT7_006742 [Hymenolepis weldensis]
MGKNFMELSKLRHGILVPLKSSFPILAEVGSSNLVQGTNIYGGVYIICESKIIDFDFNGFLKLFPQCLFIQFQPSFIQ